MNNPNLKFGLVILHYMTLEMTIQCVDNVLDKFGKNDIHIVIVDNNSANGSGQQLLQKYRNNTLVTVILHNKNDGFARGNNIGFYYLKNNYNVDFMIVMNNDVIIRQDDFLKKIEDIYSHHQFAVLGPDIYAPNLKIHQNPLEYNLISTEGCEYWIKKYKQLLRKDSFNYYKLLFLHYAVYSWAKPLAKILMPNKYQSRIAKKNFEAQIEVAINDDNFEQNEKEDVTLQGSCLIFSKEFIQKRNYAFYPETFMYYEEHILHLQCHYEGLKMVYSPAIAVNHLCGTTTDKIYNQRSKNRLYWRENINSLKIYIKLYKGYNKK